jgi:glycine/D-amino acid oxidase-like deaminating enzyme
MTHPHGAPPSLWLEHATFSPPPFEGEIETEIAIVGGGISGITLAWTLAEQSASVALFESGPLAGSASGRNAGFLAVAPAEPYPEMVALWGRNAARAVLEIGRRTHRRIKRLCETLGIEADYRASGSLRLTRTAEEADDLRLSLPLLQSDGFPMSEIPIAGTVPTNSESCFTSAFVTLEDGELHPVKFLHGLAKAAVDRRARLFPGSPVIGARWNQGVWELRLEGGVARARTLVLCTNAYAPLLCPTLDTVIKPRRGQVIATAPLGREIVPRPTYAHYGYQYWRQTPDTRLVIGGWRDTDLDRETGYDEIVTDTIQKSIEEGLRQLVPEPVAIDYRWGGIMGFARDGRPLVGWLDVEHHLAVCAGFTGHGIGMATACTQDLAELLAFKRAAGIGTFDPLRFPELRETRERCIELGA